MPVIFESQQLMGRMRGLSASKWRVATNLGNSGAQGQHPGGTRGLRHQHLPRPSVYKQLLERPTCCVSVCLCFCVCVYDMHLADFSPRLLERRSRMEPSTLRGVVWVLLRTCLPLAMLICVAGHVCGVCACVCVCVCTLSALTV